MVSKGDLDSCLLSRQPGYSFVRINFIMVNFQAHVHISGLGLMHFPQKPKHLSNKAIFDLYSEGSGFNTQLFVFQGFSHHSYVNMLKNRRGHHDGY